MTEKRQVRGLLDVIAAEFEGAEWEFIEPPLGLGFSTTPEARRWATIGYLTERLAELDAQTAKHKQRKGRPSKGQYEDIGCERALRLWCLAHHIDAIVRKAAHNPRCGVKITTRELIQLAKIVEPTPQRLFGTHIVDTTLEQSVSRGRTILEIDDEWRSEVCEKIAGISPQITK